MRIILGAWSRSLRPSKFLLAATANTWLYSDPFAGMGGGGVSGGEEPSDFAVLTRLSKAPIGSGLPSNRFGPPSVK